MVELDPPIFIATDAQERLARAIETFERETKRALKPAQPERLTLNAFAYELNLHAIQVQEAMRQGLVDFARFPMLDYLGRFYGIERLPPAAAKTTLRVTVAAQERSFTLPAATRVAAGDCVFATDCDLLIPPNRESGEVTATATVAGPSGNGFAPGQIARLLAPIAGVAAANITQSAGGADREHDEALRLRILEAPEKMTVAGSKGAYEQRVRAPVRIAYRIQAELILTREADAKTTLDSCATAAHKYAAELRLHLGRDIVPAQILRCLMVDGIHDLRLSEPRPMALSSQDWADCSQAWVAARISTGGAPMALTPRGELMGKTAAPAIGPA